MLLNPDFRRRIWAILTLRLLVYGLLVHAQNLESSIGSQICTSLAPRRLNALEEAYPTCDLSDDPNDAANTVSSTALSISPSATVSTSPLVPVPLDNTTPTQDGQSALPIQTVPASASDSTFPTPSVHGTSESTATRLETVTTPEVVISVAIVEEQTEEEEPHLPDFPSFEDWKQQHLASAASAELSAQKSGTPRRGSIDYRSDADLDQHHANASADRLASDRIASQESEAPFRRSEDATEPSSAISTETRKTVHPAPHAGSGDAKLDPLELLKDRPNYASFDCSATMIRSSKLTKSASAILSSKKDRYMLTPCASKEQFVIVELCDEIQIDTIVLANLEFFSSMFKQFRVRAGTAYPETSGNWEDLGFFRATNARGLQVFKVPDATTSGFYRYIRVDFLTHYGTEYYCPVSILRVYGATQLDAFRRDQRREAMFTTDDEEEEAVLTNSVEPTESSQSILPQFDEKYQQYLDKVENGLAHATAPSTPSPSPSTSLVVPTSDASAQPALNSTQSLEQILQRPSTAAESMRSGESSSSLHSEQSASMQIDQRKPTADAEHATVNKTRSEHESLKWMTKQALSSASAPATAPARPQTHKSASSKSESSSTIASETSQNAANLASPTATHTSSSSSTSSPKPAASGAYYRAVTAVPVKRNDTRSHPPPAQVIYTHSQNNHGHANESIYATIAKRLTALEVNATLSRRYLEEQTRLISATFRRIEDRLTGIERSRNKQDQALRRMMLEMELHRAKLESERSEWSSQLSILSKEMIIERRLGIVQLGALLVLLLFVLLTRGSPTTPLLALADAQSKLSAPLPSRSSKKSRQLPDLHVNTTPKMNHSEMQPPRTRGGSHPPERFRVPPASGPLVRPGSIKRTAKQSGATRRNASSIAGPLSAPMRSSMEQLPYATFLNLATNSGVAIPAARHIGISSEAGIPPRISASAEALSSPKSMSTGDLPHPETTQQLGKRTAVDTIRQKLRLPPRRASLGVEPSSTAKDSPSAFSPVVKRRLFSLSHTRRRSSVTSPEDEGAKAWLSTSEEEDNTVPGVSVPWPSIPPRLPPSPEPSDAETSQTPIV